MRAIIDRTGLPEAVDYYRMFPREPSVSPVFDMSITNIVPVNDITLDTLLDRIIEAIDAGEREALVVAHGEPRGFLMHITARSGVSAMQEALEIIMSTGAALARAASIRQAPANHQVALWTEFINSIEAGAIVGTITVQEAERWFNRWASGQATRLDIPRATLEEIVRKSERVRQAGLRRAEVRACNMGSDQNALAVLRRFLGAHRVMAPTVGTFYLRVIPELIPDPRRLQRWIQTFGGPVSGGVYAGRQGPSARIYRNLWLAAARPGTSGITFVLRVWETSLHPHRYTSRAASLDETTVRRWIDWNIMFGSRHTGRGHFFITGLWSFGRAGQPYTLPGDPAYRQLITSESQSFWGRVARQ